MLAVTVMLDVAFHGGRAVPVSGADIAERLGLARRGMEPLLQTLSRAELLESVRGPRGGYRLGRPARDIRIADVLQVGLGNAEDAPDGPGGRLQAAVIDPLWAKLDELLRRQVGDMTLDVLLRRASDAGLHRPASEPISFAI